MQSYSQLPPNKTCQSYFRNYKNYLETFYKKYFLILYLILVRFEPFADADRVHHILLYGCTYPAWRKSFWKGFSVCRDFGSYILYAWARNGNFAVDGRMKKKY